jgi:hypothetical protein
VCLSGFLDLFVEKEVENSIQVVGAWVAEMEAGERLQKYFVLCFVWV